MSWVCSFGVLNCNVCRRPDRTVPKKAAVPTSTREYLSVPYSSKDFAKRMGAWWDGSARQWYIGPKASPAQAAVLRDKFTATPFEETQNPAPRFVAEAVSAPSLPDGDRWGDSVEYVTKSAKTVTIPQQSAPVAEAAPVVEVSFADLMQRTVKLSETKTSYHADVSLLNEAISAHETLKQATV